MSNEKIIIEKLFENKSDGTPYKEGFVGAQLAVTQMVKSATSIALGGEGFEKRKVAFQTLNIEACNPKEGEELDLGVPARLQILESLEEQQGFQAKTTGESDGNRSITIEGQPIYRKVQLADASSGDQLIKHDAVGASTSEEVEASAVAADERD